MKVRLLFLLALLPALAQAAPDPAAFRLDALRWINAFRAAEGRSQVRLDDALNPVSQEWAAKLAGMGRLQHRSIANMQEIQGVNGYGAFNENLFMTSGTAAPDDAVEAWKKSPGHRRNLLQQNIDRIGIGVAEGSGGTFVVFNGAGGAPTPVVVPGSGDAPRSGVTFGGNPMSRPGAGQR